MGRHCHQHAWADVDFLITAPAMPHQHNKHVGIDDLVVCTTAITLTRVKWYGVVADKQE